MQAAAQMAPRRVDVQLEAARFWFRRGDIARAMKHLDVVLTFGGSLREEIFPDLLKLAEDPATREIAHAETAETTHRLVAAVLQSCGGQGHQRRNAARPVPDAGWRPQRRHHQRACRAYLQRLQRENLWIESYLVWLNNLRKDQLNAIGNLFNGGFEEEISNLGFDWIVTPASQVVVDTASTYGATGHKALRVVFRGPRIQFQHVHQYLMLDPGTYSLHGRVRPDNLEAAEGMQWSIYCVGNAKALAHSERFHGTDHWQHFTAQFTDSRPGLRRANASPRTGRPVRARFRSQGGRIWFDDLSISRQKID